MKKQKNSGITLVALIITIIVMLILVAVTVTVVVDSDIIGQAEKTGEAYRNAYANEGEKVSDETIEGGKYTTIDGYMVNLGENQTTEVKHEWIRNEYTLTCKCNTCTENGTVEAGRTLTIGDTVNYTKTGNKTSTITAEKSGMDSDQTISIEDETIEWKVLGAADNDNDNDGKNETLLLTTANPTDAKIALKGKTGCDNIDELHRICEDLYGEDARALTYVDVVEACFDQALTIKEDPEGFLYYNPSYILYSRTNESGGSYYGHTLRITYLW